MLQIEKEIIHTRKETNNMKLRYEKMNDNVVTIDLQNEYTVIAIIGRHTENSSFFTLFLKDNQIDDWKLIEDVVVDIPHKSKNVYTYLLKWVDIKLEEGFFDFYIDRCKYEMACFERGNELFESERHNVE